MYLDTGVLDCVVDACAPFFVRCVIAELFLDGQQLFDLSQLLDYRTKDYLPDAVLKKIADKHVRVSISLLGSHHAESPQQMFINNFLCKLRSHAWQFCMAVLHGSFVW